MDLRSIEIKSSVQISHCNHVENLGWTLSAHAVPWKNVNWPGKSRWWPWKLREKREKKKWTNPPNLTRFEFYLQFQIVSCVMFTGCACTNHHVIVYFAVGTFCGPLASGRVGWLGLGLAMAASLQSLPFPITELAWDKLNIVAKHLQVNKAEAFTIMHHVLGPPPTPLPAT